MHQITLTVSQNVVMSRINEHSFQNTCKSVHHQHVHYTAILYSRRSRNWLIAASIIPRSESNQVCIKRFYSAPQCSHCKRCTSYSNSVRLPICLSVTRRYCVKTIARSTVQFALSDSKMCLVFQKSKNIPEGRPLSPKSPPPKSSEF